MKTPPRDRKSDADKAKRTGAPESPESNETFPHRTDPPGQAGLANEARPGLGTRRDEPFPGEPPAAEEGTSPDASEKDNVANRQRSGQEPNDKPAAREPREQLPDSWAHEAERSTGVSGHMGGS